MREKYQSLSLAVLRELAKARGLKKISALKKEELIQRMLEQDELDAQEKESTAEAKFEAPTDTDKVSEEISDRRNTRNESFRRSRPNGDNTERRTRKPMESSDRPARQIEENSERHARPRQAEENSERHVRPRQAEENSKEYARPRQVRSYDKAPQAQGYDERLRSIDDRIVQKMETENVSIDELDSGETADGILEVLAEGYGFIRCANYMPGDNDVYVSPSQIRRFRLKTGDILVGNKRIRSQGEKFSALLYIKSVNGFSPMQAAQRTPFEDLTPIFPNQRLRLETEQNRTSMRIVDLIAPVGKGQRGMIVAQPKAGKTTLLKEVATSVKKNNPEMHLIILLIDERPEEVTDIKEAIEGENVEVIYSTFDELPEHHKRVSEMVIERAKRLVEHKKDVMILLDSITRLARAYNLVVPPSGRTLSGGLDPAALHMPKRFFGAARNMREGGSLTILATALVDTGSRMDDVVFEEFKGTGNMELILDRKLSEKRIFPAIDIVKSGTRREDLLLDKDELEAVEIMRRSFSGMKSDEAVENILKMFVKTRNNREFINQVKSRKYF